MKNTKKTTIAVIGLGYVGLPLALLCRKRKYNVIGIVKNLQKAELINKSISPIKDSILQKQILKYPIYATRDFKKISNVDIIIICVPTPVFKDYTPDYRPLISASKEIGKILRKKQLIIIESTINPGTTDAIIIPELEAQSGLKAGKDFFISHCPERINPGDKKWTLENIPRVVGSYEKLGLKKTIAFYQSILKAEIKQMQSIKEAEAVKVVENSFRDINIAFVNELAMSFAQLDIDIVNVINGAATKPFSFLAHYPGCGVGGHCIPVDPYYLIEYAKKSGFHHEFLLSARKINNNMPDYTVDLLLKKLAKIKKKRDRAVVAILGVAYKKNIDDYRESPALKIIARLKKQNIDVVIYDPYIPAKSTVKNLNEALNNIDAVIIATDHDSFAKLKPKNFIDKEIKLIIDGRNCLNKEAFQNAGLSYHGIGR